MVLHPRPEGSAFSNTGAGPSLVSHGYMSIKQLDKVSTIGFNAFALGKLLAVPVMLIGNKLALQLQILAVTLACATFCVGGHKPYVQVCARSTKL